MNIPLELDKNTLVEFYTERPVVYINCEAFADISQLPEYQFRNLVLIAMSSKGAEAWIDLGGLCYKNKTIANNLTHAARVVELSLDKTLEAVFDRFIRSKLANCAPITARSYHWRLKAFTKYYFEHLKDFDFNDYDQCCKAYEEYTKVLLLEKARKMANPDYQKGFSDLQRKQAIFAELICIFHNKNLNKFKDSYITIKGSYGETNIKPVSEDELTYFYEINRRVFLSLKDFLMGNKDFPFTFKESITEETIVHYPTDGFLRTFRKIYFDDNGYIVSEEKLEKRLQKIDVEKVGKMSLKGYRSFIKKYYETTLKDVVNQSNAFKSQERSKLINYAVSALVMCFYCESSINPAQIYTLKEKDLSNFQPSIKGFKVTILKPRAGYKESKLLVSAKMLPLINEYKQFRNWILSLVPNNQTDKMFLSLDTRLKTEDSFVNIEKYSGKNTLNYRRWLSLYMPKFEWINPTVIRKTVSNYMLTTTNSASVASQKLGNTPKVVSNHYSEVTDKQHSEQLTDFFNHVYNNIANKYRKNEEVIDVNINIEGKEIPIGSCVNSIPVLNSGFSDDLEKPNCSNPASCLFCKGYVVHSDREDIKKLMSLKKILSMSDKTEETIIVTRRINEILKILLDKYPETKEVFISVANAVESGDFDDYWRDHLNLLIKLGAKFYA